MGLGLGLARLLERRRRLVDSSHVVAEAGERGGGDAATAAHLGAVAVRLDGRNKGRGRGRGRGAGARAQAQSQARALVASPYL